MKKEEDVTDVELVTTDQPEAAISTVVTPMQLIAQAQGNNASIEYLEKLMDLQERHEAREAFKSYNSAIAEFKSKNIRIIKRTLVDFNTSKGRTTYKHASLGDAVAQVIEALCKCGLNHSWKTSQDGKLISVTCRVSHVDGHHEDTTLSAEADASGGKNSIQAIGSTVTYLERYTLKAALGLAEEDDDGKGADPEPEITVITDNQWRELDTMIDQVGAKREDFCAFYKIDNIARLPVTAFKQAMSGLEAKREKEKTA